MYQSLFARTLEGIRNATDADMSIIQQADEILSAAPFQDFEQMDILLESRLEELLRVDDPQSHLIVCVVGLALVITFLRERRLGTVQESIPDHELAGMWEILRYILESPLFKKVKVGRSHQGFLSLPFCVLTNADGSNDECWRLHVWLPSSPPPDPRLSIRSHKSFAQSWIVAGEAENTNFNITPAADDENVTNALYRLDGATNKTLTSGMKEVLSGSAIYNTGKKVIAEEASRHRYHHGQSYVVPGNAFHTTGLGSKTILATIFFFDASRGFFEEGGVPIGPVDGTEFTQYRNPEGMRSDVLVRIVEVTRRWENLTENAARLARNREWEAAAVEFDKAADLWKTEKALLRDMGGMAAARDLQDLGIYQSVAESLSAWADAMAAGQPYRARRLCESFSQFRVVAYCLSFT